MWVYVWEGRVCECVYIYIHEYIDGDGELNFNSFGKSTLNKILRSCLLLTLGIFESTV